MTPEEIIKADAKRRGVAPNQSMGRINKLFQLGGQMVQDNDTIFTFLSNGKGAVRYHFYTAEDAEGLRNSLKNFIQIMKAAGAREIFVISKNRPKYLEFLESVYDDVGLPYQRAPYQDAVILAAELNAPEQ